MPLHRRDDGTTVNVPWPPPPETKVKIHSRVVKLTPSDANSVDTVDAGSGWSLASVRVKV